MRQHKTLTKIIEFKKFKKEEIEIEVKRLKDALDVEMAKLDSLEGKLKDSIEKFNVKQKDNFINGQEIEFFYNCFSYFNSEAVRQKKVVVSKRIELEEKQKTMLAAYKEKRLLEIMHDKIVTEGIKEAMRIEQKEADSDFLSKKAKR